MRLPRLRPPVQLSLCSNCGRQLRERTRKPCPSCKGMSRTLSRTATDQMTALDKAN